MSEPTAKVCRSFALQAAAVALLAVAAHGSMLARGFVWDDFDLLEPMRLTGRWDLLAPDPYGFIRPGKALVFSALDAVFGRRAVGWEAFALASVILASVLVLRFAGEFLRPPGPFVAAAVYAAHPLHVEGAGWAAANNGTLLAILALGYYLALLRDARVPKPANLAWMTGLFLGALAMKEEAVVLPPIGALCLWAQRKRPDRRQAVAMALQLAAAGVFLFCARRQAAGAGQQLEAFPFPAWAMALSAPRTILSHMLYFYGPFWWAYFHCFDPRPIAFFSMMGGGLAAAAALAVWLWRRRERPTAPLFFILFSVVALLPLSNFIPVGNYVFGVRYLTHSGIGLALLFGWFALRAEEAAPRLRPLVRAGLCAWLLAAIFCSNAYHRDWRCNESLFGRMTLDSPQWRFPYSLGVVRFEQGRGAEAEALFRESLRRSPAQSAPRVALGMALYREGNAEEALRLWQSVEAQEPANIDMALNMAGYYETKYARSAETADRDAADRYYRISAGGRIPNSEAAFVNWGLMWIQQGEMEKAIAIWRAGLKKFPLSQDLARNLDLALRRQGPDRPARSAAP